MQRSFRLTRVLVLTLFVLSAVFYFVSKTYVNSMNISLSVEESQLSDEIAQKEQTVEELQNEVRSEEHTLNSSHSGQSRMPSSA